MTNNFYRTYGQTPRAVIIGWYGRSFPNSPKDTQNPLITQLVKNLWDGHRKAFMKWEREMLLRATCLELGLPYPIRHSQRSKFSPPREVRHKLLNMSYNVAPTRTDAFSTGCNSRFWWVHGYPLMTAIERIHLARSWTANILRLRYVIQIIL